MTIDLTYTKEFAQNIWLPYSGFKATLLTNKDSIEQDFLNHDDQWYSEQGNKYDKSEMLKQWAIISHQKIRIEKLYRNIPLNDPV